MGPAALRAARRGIRLARELRLPLVTIIVTGPSSSPTSRSPRACRPTSSAMTIPAPSPPSPGRSRPRSASGSRLSEPVWLPPSLHRTTHRILLLSSPTHLTRRPGSGRGAGGILPAGARLYRARGGDGATPGRRPRPLARRAHSGARHCQSSAFWRNGCGACAVGDQFDDHAAEQLDTRGLLRGLLPGPDRAPHSGGAHRALDLRHARVQRGAGPGGEGCRGRAHAARRPRSRWASSAPTGRASCAVARRRSSTPAAGGSTRHIQGAWLPCPTRARARPSPTTRPRRPTSSRCATSASVVRLGGTACLRPDARTRRRPPRTVGAPSVGLVVSCRRRVSDRPAG